MAAADWRRLECRDVQVDIPPDRERGDEDRAVVRRVLRSASIEGFQPI
ncbi:hypothetical protein [Nocardioides ochotonae]|nr:hypothetical protein [Nocardioides ochotonae]